MRFRAKSATRIWLIWAWAGFGAFNIIFGIHAFFEGKSFVGAVYFGQGALILVAALFEYFMPNFIYSELDATCLCVHKLCKKKEIAWQEVTSAGRFGFGTDDVIVRFGHQMEDYGYILTQPADRDEFLAAIHQYAPQAKIDM